MSKNHKYQKGYKKATFRNYALQTYEGVIWTYYMLASTIQRNLSSPSNSDYVHNLGIDLLSNEVGTAVESRFASLNLSWA